MANTGDDLRGQQERDCEDLAGDEGSQQGQASGRPTGCRALWTCFSVEQQVSALPACWSHLGALIMPVLATQAQRLLAAVRRVRLCLGALLKVLPGACTSSAALKLPDK